MGQTTPTNVGINHLLLDFADSSLSIEGTSDTLESVNRYVDTLKFTTYKIGDSTDETKAFSEVVLSEFTRSGTTASFTVKLKFDPAIFDAANAVSLSVPATTSTRSATELPGLGVFNNNPAEAGE